MDENFIQLLIWMIANEITKDQRSKEDQQKVIHKMCNSLSEECNIPINNDHILSESRIQLGKKMINFYYDHFTEESDGGDGDGAIKLIEFPLMNGKFDREFDREPKDMQPIAKGTFGNVFRVKNKFDDKLYAIKRVPIYGMGYDYASIN